LFKLTKHPKREVAFVQNCARFNTVTTET